MMLYQAMKKAAGLEPFRRHLDRQVEQHPGEGVALRGVAQRRHATAAKGLMKRIIETIETRPLQPLDGIRHRGATPVSNVGDDRFVDRVARFGAVDRDPPNRTLELEPDHW